MQEPIVALVAPTMYRPKDFGSKTFRCSSLSFVVLAFIMRGRRHAWKSRCLVCWALLALTHRIFLTMPRTHPFCTIPSCSSLVTGSPPRGWPWARSLHSSPVSFGSLGSLHSPGSPGSLASSGSWYSLVPSRSTSPAQAAQPPHRRPERPVETETDGASLAAAVLGGAELERIQAAFRAKALEARDGWQGGWK